MVSYTDQSCLRGPGQRPCLRQSSPSSPATLCPTNTTSPALILQSKFAGTKAQDTNGLIEWLKWRLVWARGYLPHTPIQSSTQMAERTNVSTKISWVWTSLSSVQIKIFDNTIVLFHIRNLSPSDLIILISIHKTNEIMSRNKTK